MSRIWNRALRTPPDRRRGRGPSAADRRPWRVPGGGESNRSGSRGFGGIREPLSRRIRGASAWPSSGAVLLHDRSTAHGSGQDSAVAYGRVRAQGPRTVTRAGPVAARTWGEPCRGDQAARHPKGVDARVADEGIRFAGWRFVAWRSKAPRGSVDRRAPLLGSGCGGAEDGGRLVAIGGRASGTQARRQRARRRSRSRRWTPLPRVQRWWIGR